MKQHCQYLAQLKATAEKRGVSLVSDTGMGAIMRAVLVGCVKIEKPDAAARTHSRALAGWMSAEWWQRLGLPGTPTGGTCLGLVT